MKKIVINLLILLPIYLNAQPFWSAVIDGLNKSHVIEKGLFQDSIILVCGSVSDASCPGHTLISYNKQGQQIWHSYRACDFISTQNDFIYTAGYDINQDDVVGDDQIVLSKYNAEGLEIFSLRYPSEDTYDYYWEFKPTSLNITEDGKILISSNISVIKSDIDGVSIKETFIKADSDIEAINSINSLSYLIHTQSSIYKSDSAFVLLDSISFTENINKTLIINDTIYTLFSTYLLRMDTSLTLIDTLIRASEFEFQKMEFYGGNIWIKGNDLDSIKLLNIKNSISIDTLTFELLADVREFIVANNNYTFIGNSFSNQIAVYNYNTSDIGSINPNLPDLTIVDFNIDSIIIDYITLPETTFAYGYSFNTELTIKNSGTDTLNTFSIYLDLNGGMNCAQNYLYQKFTDLEILPNQLYTVNLRRAYQEGVQANELCFECLAPNSELETDITNNSLCKKFVITDIENKTQLNFIVYPNPTKDFLYIESPNFELKIIELTDMNGRLLIKRAASEQKIKFEIGNLKSGIYILKINSIDNSDAKIIVKE